MDPIKMTAGVSRGTYIFTVTILLLGLVAPQIYRIFFHQPEPSPAAVVKAPAEKPDLSADDKSFNEWQRIEGINYPNAPEINELALRKMALHASSSEEWALVYFIAKLKGDEETKKLAFKKLEEAK